MITALPGEAGQAELTTDQGAIYVTNNKAYTWSAAVMETVDATLNRTVSSGEWQGWRGRRRPVGGPAMAADERMHEKAHFGPPAGRELQLRLLLVQPHC